MQRGLSHMPGCHPVDIWPSLGFVSGLMSYTSGGSPRVSWMGIGTRNAHMLATGFLYIQVVCPSREI